MKDINDLFRQFAENNFKSKKLEQQLKNINDELETIKSSILEIFLATPEWFRFLKNHTTCLCFPQKEDIHKLDIQYYQYKLIFRFENNETGTFFYTEMFPVMEIIRFLTDSNYFADELAEEEEKEKKELQRRQQEEEEKERTEYERLKAKFEHNKI